MAKKKKPTVNAKAEALVRAELVAKATYQRKRTTTEVIPPDVTRAKTAAWLTIISPLTEWAGLSGDRLRARRDQLRIQREDILLEIAKKAQARTEMEGGVRTFVPNKFLVPFLEKASLEDSGSKLCDAWANLFVEAARNFDPKLQVYADILSRISWREARLLEAICFSSKDQGVSWPSGHFEDNARKIEGNLALLDGGVQELSLDERDLMWNGFKKNTQLQYGHLLHATVVFSGAAHYYYNNDLIDSKTNQTVLFDILERESLVKRTIFPLRSPYALNTGSVSYIDLSYLAIDLINVCTRGFTNRLAA